MSHYDREEELQRIASDAGAPGAYDSMDSNTSTTEGGGWTNTDVNVTFDSISNVSEPSSSSRSSPLGFHHHASSAQLLWRRYCRSCFYIHGRKKVLMIISALAMLFVIAQLSSTLMLSASEHPNHQDRSTIFYNLTSLLDFGHNREQMTVNEIESKLRNIEVNLKQSRYMLNNIRENVLYSHPKSRANITRQDGGGQCSIVKQVDSDLEMEKIYDQVPFDNADGGVWKQGWNIQLQPEDINKKLKIFVVPHSHNDPGWIKTFDKYFREQTRPILNGALAFLSEHEDMKFIWAEVSYLSAWWHTANNDQDREKMRKLIQSGQMEVVTGGWVMNDEASAHYYSIITQMIEGHEWLQDHVGRVPLKHSWAIDPFGLSSTMAYLLKAMGFQAMVIQRVHYSIKKHLAQQQQLEFNWRQHWEGGDGDGGDILAHVQPFYSYDVPHTCGPDPKVCCQFDFKRLPPSRVKCPWKVNPVAIKDDNVEERASTLLDQYRKKAKLYRTNSLLVPLGDDFRFDKPKEWSDQYGNYKKMFDFINSREQFNAEIKFATLSDYFDSLASEERTSFPSLTGDFFTYCDRDDHYWSGYYTSKPFYKRFERILASHLRATDILFAIANLVHGGQDLDKLVGKFVYARQNLALFQHHDGITGTAKVLVVKDYAHRMFQSFLNLEQIVSGSLRAIAHSSSTPNGDYKFEFMERFRDDVSPLERNVIQLGANEKRYFVLYNSLGWNRTNIVYCFNVRWQDDKASELTIVNERTQQRVERMQINRIWTRQDVMLDDNQREICFQTTLPALSLTPFCVAACSNLTRRQDRMLSSQESFTTLYGYQTIMGEKMPPVDKHILSWVEPIDVMTIENDQIKIYFDGQNNAFLKAIQLEDIVVNVTMDIMTYGTRPGGKEVPKSGAYIFLPDSDEPQKLKLGKKPRFRKTTGRLEERLEIVINDPFPIYLRWSLYKGSDLIDFVSEVHLHGGLYTANKELLIRFNLSESIDSGERYFTDLNGFQMIARKRYDKIPIQGNVYPISAMSAIEDQNDGQLRFTILTAQPLGASSPSSGVLDTFLDRRLMQDDARGVGEALTDNKLTRESFKLLLERPRTRLSHKSARPSAMAWRESTIQLNPIIGLIQAKSDHSMLALQQNTTFLAQSLPCDVHLLGLRRATRKPRELALLLHRFGVSCDTKCDSSQQDNLIVSKMLSSSLLDRLDWQRGLERTGISLMSIGDEQMVTHPFNHSIQLTQMEIAAFKLYKHNHTTSP